MFRDDNPLVRRSIGPRRTEECHGTEDLEFLVVEIRDMQGFPTQSFRTGPAQPTSLLSACFVILVTSFGLGGGAAVAGSADRTYLADGWTIQSSAKVQAPAETISSLAFKPVDWYKATVPSTVAGNLVDDMVYQDPFFGMNLRSIPGTDYPVGTNFSNRPMPADQPVQGFLVVSQGIPPDRRGREDRCG